MAGRSSQADNRGSDYFGLLVSGKGKDFIHLGAGRALPRNRSNGGTTTNIEEWYNTKYIPLLHQVRLLYLILEVYPQILNIL